MTPSLGQAFWLLPSSVYQRKLGKLAKYVLPRVKKLEKSTFNDDLVVISKELERLYINVNPSKWKSFNYRNIHSWCYSIIGKHSSVHTGTAAFEYSIRNCHSLSDYIVITKPFHATQPFIRIEILIFQGQERQVFSSKLTYFKLQLWICSKASLCCRCWKIRRRLQAYWKKFSTMNSGNWY